MFEGTIHTDGAPAPRTPIATRIRRAADYPGAATEVCPLLF